MCLLPSSRYTVIFCAGILFSSPLSIFLKLDMSDQFHICSNSCKYSDREQLSVNLRLKCDEV